MQQRTLVITVVVLKDNFLSGVQRGAGRKQIMLDLERLYRGAHQIKVQGVCNSPVRAQALEHAIAAIQNNPASALKERYIGVKNYASFGDQREDHENGMGPRHGSIVFSVKRITDGPLDDDAVYLLEAARDFGLVETGRTKEYGARETLDLCGVMERRLVLKRELDSCELALETAHVETHVSVNVPAN